MRLAYGPKWNTQSLLHLPLGPVTLQQNACARLNFGESHSSESLYGDRPASLPGPHVGGSGIWQLLTLARLTQKHVVTKGFRKESGSPFYLTFWVMQSENQLSLETSDTNTSNRLHLKWWLKAYFLMPSCYEMHPHLWHSLMLRPHGLSFVPPGNLIVPGVSFIILIWFSLLKWNRTWHWHFLSNFADNP